MRIKTSTTITPSGKVKVRTTTKAAPMLPAMRIRLPSRWPPARPKGDAGRSGRTGRRALRAGFQLYPRANRGTAELLPGATTAQEELDPRCLSTLHRPAAAARREGQAPFFDLEAAVAYARFDLSVPDPDPRN